MDKEIMKNLPSDSQGEDCCSDKPLVCSNGGQNGFRLLEKSIEVGGVVVYERVDLGHNDRWLDRGRHIACRVFGEQRGQR